VSELRLLAERVAAAARDVTDVKSAQDRIERTARVAEDVREAVDRAELPATALAAMHADGVAVMPSVAVQAAAQAAAAATAAVRTGQPSDPADDSGRRLRDAINDLRDALRSQATATWRDAGLKSSLAGRIALLKALAMVPAFKARADEAARLATSLAQDVASDYLPAAQYRVFRETLDEFEEAFKAFDLSAVREASVFLLRSANGTATVADVTPEVRAWLRRHDLETAFDVRPSRG
jgi:hypothetical protein